MKKVMSLVLILAIVITSGLVSLADSSVDSDVTGLNALYSCTHASHVETFSNGNKTVEITTRGRAVFGVSIEGFDLGISYTKYMTDKFTVVYE